MKLTPSSSARWSTAIASSRSSGSPQIPSPVIRIAPKPRRRIVLPARSKVPVEESVSVAGIPSPLPGRASRQSCGLGGLAQSRQVLVAREALEGPVFQLAHPLGREAELLAGLAQGGRL